MELSHVTLMPKAMPGCVRHIHDHPAKLPAGSGVLLALQERAVDVVRGKARVHTASL